MSTFVPQAELAELEALGTMCATCHHFNGDGGSIDPDLTGSGNRYQNYRGVSFLSRHGRNRLTMN